MLIIALISYATMKIIFSSCIIVVTLFCCYVIYAQDVPDSLQHETKPGC